MEPTGGTTGHSPDPVKRELVRHIIVIILVLVLGTIVIVGMIGHYDAGYVAQIASPISGVVGVAIGWLFPQAK
jgi:hypothetical protein